MMRKWVYPIDLKVNVASGTGFATAEADIDGHYIKTIITPPPGNPTYDYNVTDNIGAGIVGRTGLQGNESLQENEPCKGPLTFTILNATVDGIYSVRIYIDRGFIS